MARILIADDEESTVELLARIITLLGHEPIPTYSGLEALARIESEVPDLVLLDLMMPEVDGYETLRRIRRLPHGRFVPVVVITASPEPDVEERVHLAGGDKVYHKPISIAMLTEAIETQIERRHELKTAPLPHLGA